MNFELNYHNSPAVIIAILGMISNMLLLVAFAKDPLKCFRNSATYLVINLTVCDCLACLLGPMFHVSVLTTAHSTGWRRIYTLFVYCFATASMISITSISVDRFLMIAYPLKHRVLVRGKALIVWLAIIWISSSSFFAVKMFYGDLEKTLDVIIESGGIIIVIFSSVLYASTYYKLKKQSSNIALQNSIKCRAQEKRILKEKRFLKTIILIACIALVCIVPPLIVFQLSKSMSNVPASIFAGILYINFAVNPLIYILRFPNYRKTFYLLYCSRRRCGLWKVRAKFCTASWSQKKYNRLPHKMIYVKVLAKMGKMRGKHSRYFSCTWSKLSKRNAKFGSWTLGTERRWSPVLTLFLIQTGGEGWGY